MTKISQEELDFDVEDVEYFRIVSHNKTERTFMLQAILTAGGNNKFKTGADWLLDIKEFDFKKDARAWVKERFRGAEVEVDLNAYYL